MYQGRRRRRCGGPDFFYLAGRCSSAVVANANAYSRRPEADARTRSIILIAIAAPVVVSLAWRVAVGIANDHAAVAAAVVASSILVTHHTNRLHEIRVGVATAREHVRRTCAAGKQSAGTSQQGDCDFLHGSSSCPTAARYLKPAVRFRSGDLSANARNFCWHRGRLAGTPLRRLSQRRKNKTFGQEPDVASTLSPNRAWCRQDSCRPFVALLFGGRGCAAFSQEG